VADELSPKELKRLRTLEENIQKARAQSKELTTERNQLKRNLAAAEKAKTELNARLAALTETQNKLAAARDEALKRAAQANEYEKQIKKQNEQINQLVEENRKLAEQIEKLGGDLPILRDATLVAGEKIEAAQKEAAEALQKSNYLEKELSEVSAIRDKLSGQVTTLSAQLKEQGKTPLLPADKVADLLEQLINHLRRGTGSLTFAGGEIKLKVGFGAAGEHSGFLIPTPDSGPEIREVLNEIVIRFDRPLSGQ
jgi:chromosome segregation ATPase